MAGPKFSKDTIDLLAFRSALICNNPDCKKLTVGPSSSTNPLKLLFGEGAHICSAKKGTKANPQARFDANMTDAQRAHFDNGVWLCANCHTMVDKNSGADFTAMQLRQWKEDHEAAIASLMKSQESPFPYLRQYAIESEVAQDLVNMLESKGVLFEHEQYEVDEYMVLSIIGIRDSLGDFVSKVKHDEPLQNHIKEILEAFRYCMNVTGNFRNNWQSELRALRNRLGGFLRILEKEYGSKVTGKLRKIL